MATGRDSADEVLRAVGRRIAEIRRAAGLTQEQAAERLEVSPRAYAYLEGGRQNLTLRTLIAVGNVLGASVSDFLVKPASRQTRRGRPPRASASEAPSPWSELERVVKLAASSAEAQARSGVEWISDVTHVLHALERAMKEMGQRASTGSMLDAEQSREFLRKLRDLSVEFLAASGKSEGAQDAASGGDTKTKGRRR